jgi:prolyl 4-hydroxylase
MDVQARAEAGETVAQLELARRHEQDGRTDLARGWFARAAQAGNAGALRCLASSLLTRTPMAVRDGVEMMRQAAEQGDADAAHVCAVIAAQDGRLQERWTLARQFLDLAVKNGSALAQAQAEMLTPDLDQLAVPPPPEQVFGEPRIEICRGFASPQECRWLMGRARPRLKAAQLYDPASGGGFRGENIRNNSDTSFDLLASDMVIALLRARIAAWTGADIHAMEPPMVLQYREGQHFAPHRDALDPDLPAMAQQIRLQGQRIATALVYLNDGYDGGETDFPELGWRFKGAPGDALCFWNVDASGQPAPRTLHAGLPPRGGEKWVFSQWIRAPA